VGVNVVLASGVSSGHAEVVALGLAQSRSGSWDLGGAGLPAHELVVNWRPCIQCYGATMWSGVRTLVVAGEGPELEEITTFDEGPLGSDWAEQFERAGGAWILPYLRRMADGEDVGEIDLEHAYFDLHGHPPGSYSLTTMNWRG